MFQRLAYRTRSGAVLAIVLVLPVLPAAAEDSTACRFDHAVYTGQSGWTVSFTPVGRESAANQSASFVLRLASGSEFTGAVYWPNGYGAPVYLIEGPCSSDADSETCEFPDNGGATPYVLTASGIERIPEQMDGGAPQQLLLPDLAVSLWYSSYRDEEFDGDPGDVLTFSGCGAD